MLILPRPDSASANPAALDRALLAAGALAGPLYLGLGLAQALARPGFDLGRHDLSLLANGDFGWIQVGNFLLTGLLVIAGAFGLRRTALSQRDPASGPWLIAGYGVGLIGAGLFVADPAFGFPPGSPPDSTAISWHGLLHILSAALGFLALIAACGVFSRRFAAQSQAGWAIFSAVTGVVFLAGFVGIATGSGQRWAVLSFWLAVLIAWSWLTAITVRRLAQRPD
ncbi:MAG: DUF998 domain-containing protein [Chloroflexi bacterium]|nr:DUF998 domain-containing protein [Chloroflexota bacterium]